VLIEAEAADKTKIRAVDFLLAVIATGCGAAAVAAPTALPTPTFGDVERVW
jgi:hypothetical protein